MNQPNVGGTPEMNAASESADELAAQQATQDDQQKQQQAQASLDRWFAEPSGVGVQPTAAPGGAEGPENLIDPSTLPGNSAAAVPNRDMWMDEPSGVQTNQAPLQQQNAGAAGTAGASGAANGGGVIHNSPAANQSAFNQPSPTPAPTPTTPTKEPPAKVPPTTGGRVGLTPSQAEAYRQSQEKIDQQQKQFDATLAKVNQQFYAQLDQQQQQFLMGSALKNPWLQSLGAMMPTYSGPGGPSADALKGGLDPTAIPEKNTMISATPFAKAAWMTAYIMNSGRPYEQVINDLRQTYGDLSGVLGGAAQTQMNAAGMSAQDIANAEMNGWIGGQTPAELWGSAKRSWAPATSVSTNLGV